MATGASPLTGTRRVLVVPVFFTAPDDVRPGAVAAQIRDGVDAVYRQSSYGVFGFTARALPWQRVRTEGPRPCHDLPAMRTLAARAARAAGTDPDRFDHVVVYASSRDCPSGAGLGELPGRWVLLEGTVGPIAHELGHNLGLEHANTLTCVGAGGRRVTLSDDCVVEEYLDRYDLMGLEQRAFNAPNRASLGWLAGRSRTVDRSGAFVLAPLERPDGGLAALRVDTGLRTYWLESRRPIGADRGLPAGVTDGVLVHLDNPAGTTELLDLTPRTYAEPGQFPVADEDLSPGRSWNDPEQIVRITVGQRTAGGLPVTVTFVAPPVQQLAATAAPDVRLTWRAHPGTVPDGVVVRRGSGVCPDGPRDGVAIGGGQWRTSQSDTVTSSDVPAGSYACYSVFARYGDLWSPAALVAPGCGASQPAAVVGSPRAGAARRC